MNDSGSRPANGQKTAELEDLQSVQPTPGNPATSSSSTASSTTSSTPTSATPSVRRRRFTLKTLTAGLVVLALIGLTVGALAMSGSSKNKKDNDVTKKYPVASAGDVLGEEADQGGLAVQGLSEVSINGKLILNGGLVLSQSALNTIKSGVNVDNKVDLVPSVNGAKQTGNISISGTVLASNFQGNGADLLELNASNLSSGTVDNDRLSSKVTLLGQTIPLSALQSSVLGSINSLATSGGNVDIVAGTGITITTDSNTNQITIDNTTSGGDITGLTVGTGLIGGGTSGDLSIDLDSNTVTLQGNSFNGNNQLVKLNSSGAFPALNGSNLTGLSASNISLGTLSDARLSANVTTAGNSFNGNTQLVQTTAGGALPALSGVNLIALNASNVSSGSLADARLSANVTLQGNIFNGSGQLVQLNGSGALPALSGANLTALNASNIASGTIGDARLSSSVTVQGNAFNGISQLVKLNGAGELPALSGLNLTNLNASNIVSGTVTDSRLSANVTLQGNTFNLASKLVQLDGSGNLPALNGSALTSLNASNISSGSLADGRLSANVALLNASQTFSGAVTFSQTLTVNTIQPSSAMVIGATNQSLTLQGDMTTALVANDSGNSVTLGFTGTPTGDVIYNLDAATTPGTYTICTSVGNCASGGSSVTTAGGTTNKLVKFTGAQSVGDSSISDTGSLVTVGASGLFKASSDSTTAFRVQNAAGSTNVFTVDTSNTRVAIGQASASYPLDVAGDINSTTGLRVDGNLVCNSTGCLAGSGSGFYIQNSSSLQTDANINIESTATGTPTLVVKAKSSQTADLFEAKNSSSSVVASVDKDGNINTTGQFRVSGSQIASGNLSDNSNIAKLNGNNTYTGSSIFQKASNSTSAFQIQNAAGTSNLLIADTSNTRLGIGMASPGYTLDVNGDINIASGSAYRINGVAICGPTATCAPSSGSSNYIQNDVALQVNSNINIQTISDSSVVAIFKGAASQSADILQARDSDNNVLAKITSSGAIYQGTSQVCDASNNCGYAIASGSSNYIQNGTSQQTGNMNIKSAANGSVVAVLQGASSQSADLLQLKNGGGTTVANIDKDGNMTATSFSGSGAGLTGLAAGNISSGTLSDSRLSTNVTTAGNSFNGNSQLVQTTAGGALPALSGANLTTLNASNISSGSLADGRLSANVTLQGNTFNGASQLLQLDSSGNLPVVNGAAVTSLSATNIASGSLSDSRLSANVTLLGNSFNGNSQLVQTTAGGALPALSGASLTSLNASNISSGSLSDSRLSANVTLLNGTNTFVGATTFQNTANSTAALTIANSSSVALFVADTTNKYIIIGSSVANANPVLLVLNNYNSGTDPAGTDGAMYYNSSTGHFRCKENGQWMDCVASALNHDFFGLRPTGSSACSSAWQGIGLATNLTGSSTACIHNPQTGGSFESATTAATTGSTVGFSSATFKDTRRGWSPTCTMTTFSHSTAAQSNMRVFIGLFSGSLTNADDPLSGSYIAFRYSTVASDTGWRAMSRDGSTQNVETGNVSSVTMANSTMYTLRIRFDPVTTNAYLSVNGGAETTVSSNLPASTTSLGVATYIYTNENVSKTWNFGKFYCEQN